MLELATLKEKVLSGYRISKEEAFNLVDLDLEELCFSADDIRKHFCQDNFNVCSIINAKRGGCGENCKFCAQSGCWKTGVETHSIIDKETALNAAGNAFQDGIKRFDMVTAGRTLNDEEVTQLCENAIAIKQKYPMSICSSNGLLTYSQLKRLKESGITRYHNNLETSRRFFPNICTSHTYDEKINTLENAKKLGFELCSGGIFGVGESWEDRIDMAFQLLKIGVKSNPINFLSPIKGTPFENKQPLRFDEALRIVAIYRFILVDSAIKIAGGRSFYGKNGYNFFKSGANSTLSGAMLTTKGMSCKEDLEEIVSLGYQLTDL